MSAPTREQLERAWSIESDRRYASKRPLAQYERGLITLPELIAELQRIITDESTWCTPGATFPVEMAAIYARYLRDEPERL